MSDIKKDLNKEKAKDQIIFLIFSKYYNIFVVFIILMTVLVSFLYLLKPEYAKIAEEKQKILAEKNDERDNLGKLYQKMKDYQTTYDNISDDDKEKIDNMFIDNKNKEGLFGEIEELISGQGMIMSSIKLTADKNQKSAGAKTTSTTTKATEAGTIGFDVDIVGVDYNGLKRLLGTFEHNLRIMDIGQLDFSPNDKTVSMEVTAYYLK
jgi:hypothetical protein